MAEGLFHFLKCNTVVCITGHGGHGWATFLFSLHVQFIDALELKNLQLVGVSMGALISATYASTFPHKVNSICLMSMPCKEGGDGGEEEKEVTLAWEGFREGAW